MLPKKRIASPISTGVILVEAVPFFLMSLTTIRMIESTTAMQKKTGIATSGLMS